MKISYINNAKNIAFGYDKQANQDLTKKLELYKKSNDSQWCDTLLQLQSYCNGLEDNIRAIEKTAKNDKKMASRMQDYVDLFLSAKESLVAFVYTSFNNFDFADKEFNHYKKQLASKKTPEKNWRYDVCKAIQTWCNAPVSIEQIYAPKTVNKAKDEKPVVQPAEQSAVNETPKPEIPDVERPTSTQTQAQILNPKSFLEIFHNTPTTPKGFCDVAGMAKLKEELNDGIIQYMANPEQAKLDFEEYGKTMPKAILLYGPPGCGKTYITQALSQEVQTPLYMLNISKAGSHYINLTSKNIKDAFDQVAHMSEKLDKPVMLFMDEIDTMAFDRSGRGENEDLKQVGTLLQEIDKIKNSNVIVIGATNKVNLLDPAIRRRFDMKTLVDIPDFESIQALVKKNLSAYSKGATLLTSDKDIEEIAKQLKGFSNSSICAISKQAALNAMKRDRADIALEDYEKAIKETTEEKPDRTLYLSEAAGSKKIGF